ncbi:RelA/SpoT domain-containing protein [Sphingomonas sp. KRR8]|uniref:GTP pyrophosphokinase n=1 Tax=Sphingomonas sp. KRR8 TaxID=2942996 RepID=UPI0020205BD9|nr:RelA/SpoT domain-containing protein [Sphingomonas sp. KRR8]URD60274.1 RelA/SpoT domain-containing protein [Sphingomonas sp. KRR8]
MAHPSADLVTGFVARLSDYYNLTQQIAGLLRSALSEESLKFLIVESRVKDVESFKKKLTRPEKSYTSLSQVPDLAGVRVVAFYQDDCVKIAEIVKREFLVVEEELSHQQDQLGSDKFGYISAHYIVKCAEARKDLIEWRRIADLQCEIQIRTVIQHAWSAVSHELQYKNEEASRKLERRLNRIAGLFELADEEFVGLREQRKKLAIEREKNLSTKNAKTPLTVTAVARFSLRWLGGQAGLNRLRTIGYEIEDTFDNDAANQVISLSKSEGIDTVQGVIQAVGEFDVDYMKAQYEADRASGLWSISPSFALVLHLIRHMKNKINSDQLISLGWDKSIADRVIKIAKAS